MTRLDAFRQIVSRPREVGMDRIGYRVIEAKSDGRERLTHVVRVLRSVLRRKAA